MAGTKKTVKAAEVAAKKEEIKAVAETAVEAVKETAEKAKTATKKTASKAKAATKETAAKAKTAAKKTVSKTKAAAEKVVAKDVCILQVSGKAEIDIAAIAEACKADYKAKTNKSAKAVTVYIKPEEGVAYYTVNGVGAEDYKVTL